MPANIQSKSGLHCIDLHVNNDKHKIRETTRTSFVSILIARIAEKIHRSKNAISENRIVTMKWFCFCIYKRKSGIFWLELSSLGCVSASGVVLIRHVVSRCLLLFRHYSSSPPYFPTALRSIEQPLLSFAILIDSFSENNNASEDSMCTFI